MAAALRPFSGNSTIFCCPTTWLRAPDGSRPSARLAYHGDGLVAAPICNATGTFERLVGPHLNRPLLEPAESAGFDRHRIVSGGQQRKNEAASGALPRSGKARGNAVAVTWR